MIDGVELFLMGDYGQRWCRFHSDYKGWGIWREWDLCGGHGRMSYFGVKDGEEPLHAKNLDGIKAAISEAVS